MKELGIGGSVVMISSILNFNVVPSQSVHCSIKASLDQLTRSLAVELGPLKKRVLPGLL